MNTLLREGLPITLRLIARTAERLDGRPLSPTTVQRNEAAYTIYLGHRRAALNSVGRSRLLKELVGQHTASEQQRLAPRIRQLRRATKDDLIAKVLAQERLLDRSDQEAVRLRDDILGLSEQLQTARGLTNVDRFLPR